MKAIRTRHRSCLCKHRQLVFPCCYLQGRQRNVRSIGLLGDFRKIRLHTGESDNFTQGPNFADFAIFIITIQHYNWRNRIDARNNIKSPSPFRRQGQRRHEGGLKYSVGWSNFKSYSMEPICRLYCGDACMKFCLWS
jgi:hypothetical protein